MKVGERASSETFADYTLSRVPRVIRESLTDEQYQAIRTSLIARDTDSRHSIDIRLTIPLFFRNYYFIFFAGRDRRASRYILENERWALIPSPIRMGLRYMVSFAVSLVMLGLAFTAAYKLKQLMGIDLFPNFHLSDLLPFELSHAGNSMHIADGATHVNK
jgi:hypothetical protein